MNAKELAAKLNGREYGAEILKSEEIEADKAGLVVVFGYSDDGVEFRGAIDDEAGACNGVEIVVTEEGLLVSDCGDDECPYFKQIERRHIESGNIVHAKWSDGDGPAWTYATGIPHETFEIMEDGAVWCVGIVFALADLKDV